VPCGATLAAGRDTHGLGPGAAATISPRKVSPARGAALLQETGRTSHNPLGKANRHEFAPPHGEQNLAVSE